MSTRYVLLTGFLTALALLLLGLLFTYSDEIAILNPKGMIALKERDLMIIATVLMLIVVIPVFILTIAMAWEYRASNTNAEYTPEWDFNLTVESIWWGFPFAIVIILSFVAWESSHDLDPFKSLPSSTKPLRIQVVALQWKWLFIYPEQHIATVNFIQVPDQTPLNFELTADAPMNSFWVPELGGQIYAMPGMKSKLHLIADQPGTFRGSSANISGMGFSGMTFEVRAGSQVEFDHWVESVKKSTSSLGLEEYLKLAKPSSYVAPEVFLLGKENLFDWILMKPMMIGREKEDRNNNNAAIQSH